MLDIRNLRVDKSGRTICRVPELKIGHGERIALVGPNGSGKTTLLRVIGGLENEFTGQCQADVPEGDRVYVHQAPYLFRGSVLFNATYGLAARRMSRRKRTATAREWLGKLGVGHLIGRRSANLSGGERRRVALARAFATQAKLLLLDEPLADLDQQGIDLVCGVISRASRSTILMSSPIPLPDALNTRSYGLGRS